MKRPELAAHIKAQHYRVAPGIYSLAELKRFHAYLHRTYTCDHDERKVP